MSIKASKKYPANCTLDMSKYNKQVDKIAKGKYLGEFTEDACISNWN